MSDFSVGYVVNSVVTVSHKGEKWDDYSDTAMVSLSFKDIRRPGAVEIDTFGENHLSGISIDYERTGGNSQGQ